VLAEDATSPLPTHVPRDESSSNFFCTSSWADQQSRNTPHNKFIKKKTINPWTKKRKTQNNPKEETHPNAELTCEDWYLTCELSVSASLCVSLCRTKTVAQSSCLSKLWNPAIISNGYSRKAFLSTGRITRPSRVQSANSAAAAAFYRCVSSCFLTSVETQQQQQLKKKRKQQ
jgi:hypothetical protein